MSGIEIMNSSEGGESSAKGSSDHDHQSSEYDRAKELKAFDETKEGVKGLVDAGVVKVPKIFMRPPDENMSEKSWDNQNGVMGVPVIDMSGIRNRKEVVEEIRIASETWGFFQVVNHGIPLHVLEGMIEGIRMFNEQDVEVKKDYYSRDLKRAVKFNCNYDLYRSRAANWRDTLTISIPSDGLIHPQLLPAVCREATIEYMKGVTEVGDVVLELLSEALGLEADHLRGMGYGKESSTMVCHYYPACPQPELTMGSSKHTDPSCLTVLLQDQIGGLQVLYDNQYWVDVHPIPGSLIINIGDFLQVMSNGKLKSVYHRVIAGRIGPRISTAWFLSGSGADSERLCGPLKELISSEQNPPVYRDFLVADYIGKFMSKALDDSCCLDYFKL